MSAVHRLRSVLRLHSILHGSPSRNRALQGLLIFCVFALVVVTLQLGAQALFAGVDVHWSWSPVKHLYWTLRSEVWLPLTTDPKLYIGLPCLLLLQGLIPARKHERWYAKALLTDAVWMLTHAITVAIFIGAFLVAAKRLVDPLTFHIHLELLSRIPGWAQILVGYLLIELLGWFSHMLRHKVNVLWAFHAVHHSQVEMNPFTLFRIHPVDYLAAEAITLLPSIFFEQTLGIVLAYLGIARLHDALTHSNIKTNLGLLRFIFVTPQSHRVHHSAEPEYLDMNFGVTLGVWDRLFGTHSPSDTVYPRTGISDKSFPLEDAPVRVSLLLVPIRQLAYPFIDIVRQYHLRSASSPTETSLS